MHRTPLSRITRFGSWRSGLSYRANGTCRAMPSVQRPSRQTYRDTAIEQQLSGYGVCAMVTPILPTGCLSRGRSPNAPLTATPTPPPAAAAAAGQSLEGASGSYRQSGRPEAASCQHPLPSLRHNYPPFFFFTSLTSIDFMLATLLVPKSISCFM